MTQVQTYRELFRHSDWASNRVREAAATLSQQQWDRSFEIGKSTLRQTLTHITDAEHAWLERIVGHKIEDSRSQRERILESLADEDVSRTIHYSDFKGNPRSQNVCDILLHICNHAMHHHAQALNILRHSGIVKVPRLDYIFMYYENPNLPPPTLSLQVLKEYFAYTDWGRQRVMSVIEELDDAALDKPFEMGMGSIRKNMVHTLAAEEFWLNNWQGRKDHQFLKADEQLSLPELTRRFGETSAQRNAFLEKTAEADLVNPVEARTPDGRVLHFPLGVTILQLCNHGTHHRAQTINMLRRCGKTVPPTDYVVWKRETRSEI